MTVEQRGLARAIGVPCVRTFVDPAPAQGGHDGIWVLEATPANGLAVCLLDGTVPFASEFPLHMMAAILLGVKPVTVLAAANLVPSWLALWRSRAIVIEDLRDRENLARLTAGLGLNVEDAASVVIVAPQLGPLCSPAALETLRHRMPNVRPLVVTSEPLLAEHMAALASSGGAYVIVKDRAPVAYGDDEALFEVALEVIPGRDVQVSCARRSWPVLGEMVCARVDAVTPHLDEPVFVAHVHGVRRGRPHTIGVFHVARLQDARPPTADQYRCIEPASPRAPSCTALATTTQHDRWVKGEVVFQLPDREVREPLHPAMLITGTTARVELTVEYARVMMIEATGNVRIDGRYPYWPQPPEEDDPGADDVLRPAYDGCRIGIDDDMVFEIDDIVTRFVVRAASPRAVVDTVIEGEITSHPSLIVIDGVPIDARIDGGSWQLWCRGRRLRVTGRIENKGFGSRVVLLDDPEAQDLRWLLAAAHRGPLAGHNREPITSSALTK
jgi:hypothetical protein